jgi:hypothetical protein
MTAMESGAGFSAAVPEWFDMSCQALYTEATPE